IKEGPEHWPERREAFGDAVVDTLAEYFPGLRESILYRQVLTPWDLEQEFGLTEGNIFHGELSLEQLLFLRPAAGWARYRTPIEGLWVCGSGTPSRRRDHGCPRRAGGEDDAAVEGAVSRYDDIVIGAGVDGLVAATRLGAAGQRVLVVDRAEGPGGRSAAHEFHPGYRSPGLLSDTAAFRPILAKELDLARFGVRRREEAVRCVTLCEDGTTVDPEASESPWHAWLSEVAPVLESFVDASPLELLHPERASFGELLRRGYEVRRLGRKTMMELLRVPPMSISD
ncbi:MAG: NAD(P)-binding protein, partial [Gammaproteobacteria bacterium]|nr:NAD(P)-binding protein [Gammaproteobacteria bacterium]